MSVEFLPYRGSHDCEDIDLAIDRSIANEAAIATKQDALTTEQLAAVNSGIDSTKVAAIAANTNAVATKQEALTETQLAAVNSGIDSDKVAVISDSSIISLYDLVNETQYEDGTIKKDITASAVFKDGTTLDQSNFIESTVYNYLSNTASSATAKISNPIRVRNFDGTLIADVECTYGDNLLTGNIGFGFKRDGTHDIKYNASNVEDGKIVFSNTTYYFVILKYTTVDLSMTCELGKVSSDTFLKKLVFPSVADIEDMSVTTGGVIKRDIITFMTANDGKTLTASNFAESNVYNYKTYLTTSSSAKTLDLLRVRNEDGSLITPIYCTYGSNIGAANICFGYKKDGTPDRVYKAVDVVSGVLTLDPATYFILILKYSTVDLDIYTLYGKLKDVDTTIARSIANEEAIATKQDALTETQLLAVNSGINTTKVSMISDNSIVSLYDLAVGTQDDDGTIHKDIIASAVFKDGVTLSQDNFNASTVYDYLSNTTSSASAKVSNPIRVRNFDGTLIADVECEYADSLLSANIGFGFKKDGSHDVKYNAQSVSNGKITFSNDTYYFVILKYTTVDLSMKCTLGKITTDSFLKKLVFPSLTDIEDMSVTSGGALRRDIIGFMSSNPGKTLTASNFELSTIYDYKDYLTSSSTAKVVDIVRVRNDDGSMITPIYCTYGSNIGAANICFGYKKDGTHDRVYKAADVVNGVLTLDATTYFILILKYNTVDLELYTLYGKLIIGDMVPHYSVGSGVGMDFSSFTACIRALASDSSAKVIDIYGGEYDILDEMGGTTFLASLTGNENWYDVCDIVPPNTKIQGHGNVRLIMELPSDTPQSVAVLLAPVNIRGTTTIKNVSIIGKNCRYAIHPEGSKEAQFDNALWLIEDCYIEKTEESGVSVTGVGFACGLNDGVQFVISRTDIYTNCDAGFSMHDNGVVYDVSPRVVLDSCSIMASTYPLIFSCTSRQDMQTVIEVRVSNTFLNNGYCRKRTSSDSAKDCYKCVYINSPHRTQHGSNLTDPIPDTDYNAFAQ